MPKPYAADRARPAAIAAALLAAAGADVTAAGAAATSAPAGDLRFEQAFATPRATSVHYQARFIGSDGRETVVEGWRDGESRARRVTGGALEIHASHRPGAAEYRLTVLDLRRKLLTRIDRSNLYRLGNFTDWFDLAHGLRRPKGAYRVVRSPAAAEMAEAPVAACAWYDLEQQGHTNRVCWEARSQLPLAIVDAGGRTVWRVTRLDLGPVAPSVFEIDARGFVALDANQDIEKD